MLQSLYYNQSVRGSWFTQKTIRKPQWFSGSLEYHETCVVSTYLHRSYSSFSDPFCHALICFTCPCACLHPLQVSPIFPTYPLGIYTCVICLSLPVHLVCSSQPVFCLSSFFSPVSFFLVLLVMTPACHASEPACRPVHLPLLWNTDRCLT